ncbi:hypothetical protein ZIOFF_050584 [Zingiber officinale]|uniref:Uncharacterized protein n=1 Tax=Zingiber officinale TaxID=94328 RepID=A0A8J5KGK8_ZINOF|nr:hypothetical protein ZIOFF_050584 [Zingiber officinale]
MKKLFWCLDVYSIDLRWCLKSEVCLDDFDFKKLIDDGNFLVLGLISSKRYGILLCAEVVCNLESYSGVLVVYLEMQVFKKVTEISLCLVSFAVSTTSARKQKVELSNDADQLQLTDDLLSGSIRGPRTSTRLSKQSLLDDPKPELWGCDHRGARRPMRSWSSFDSMVQWAGSGASLYLSGLRGWGPPFGLAYRARRREKEEKKMGWSWQWSLCLCAIGACTVMAVKVLEYLWWRPRRVERHFAKQGIRGPPYRFFIGCVKEMVGLMLEASSKPMMMSQNQHNILPRVLAFYHHWKKIYGTVNAWHDLFCLAPSSHSGRPLLPCSPFLLWFGPTPRLAVTDPELIREIMLSRSEVFERYESHLEVRRLEGEGLVSLRGEKWAHHRRVLTPAFHIENLRLLIPFVGKTALGMVEKLPVSGEEVEIDVSEWFQTVTEDAITRTAFGRSFDDGKAVFKLQTQQMAFAAEAFRNIFIPGYRYRVVVQLLALFLPHLKLIRLNKMIKIRFLPTKKNTSSWKLEKQIKNSLVELIGRRREMKEEEKGKQPPRNVKDLLGLMINASEPKQSTAAECPRTVPTPASSWMTVHDIVEECKTFFFAGKQTTSNLLTWTTVLLAMHPEWQERARAEVLRVCGPRDVPSREHLPKLKTLTMIIYETLRLYPPAVATIRQAKADVELGGYHIPQGTELLIPIMGLHHDAELWGPDVAQFNPERFANGAARAARHPTAFIPFGLGSRMCIGQNLALLEAKITIAVLLQRFSFRLAPSYVHAPTVLLLLYPQFGAPVLFRSLTS